VKDKYASQSGKHTIEKGRNEVKILFQNYGKTTYKPKQQFSKVSSEKKIPPLNKTELRNFTATVRSSSTLVVTGQPTKKAEPKNPNMVALYIYS
jgi:hypothetical protein